MAGEKLETVAIVKEEAGPNIKNFTDFWSFLKKELKPKGNIATPFNIISVPIIITGLVLIIIRFAFGLGATTNLTQEFPWGVWIGFDVVVGVAFAAGGYVLAFMVYVLGMEKYRPVLRATVLNSFLAYVFYAGAIMLDIGRWWNGVNAFLGREFGVSSVMFIVAWHFLLYMLTLALEVSPVVAEWLGMKRLRKTLGGLTLGAVVFGVMLSIHHQSGLGALFTMAKAKIHPLWYSEFIPVLFFVSSVYSGLSLVIFEGAISHKVFGHQISEENHHAYPDILAGLARICAGVMFCSFFLNFFMVHHEGELVLLNTPMGYWFLIEMIGLLLIPCFLFVSGAQRKNIPLIRFAAILSLFGIIINRLNYSFIAYNWYLPSAQKYTPSWMEIMITLTIILIEIWVFRWMVNRMPVIQKAPEWANALEKH